LYGYTGAKRERRRGRGGERENRGKKNYKNNHFSNGSFKSKNYLLDGLYTNRKWQSEGGRKYSTQGDLC